MIGSNAKSLQFIFCVPEELQDEEMRKQDQEEEDKMRRCA
jgi:hypothetical protein